MLLIRQIPIISPLSLSASSLERYFTLSRAEISELLFYYCLVYLEGIFEESFFFLLAFCNIWRVYRDNIYVSAGLLEHFFLYLPHYIWMWTCLRLCFISFLYSLTKSIYFNFVGLHYLIPFIPESDAPCAMYLVSLYFSMWWTSYLHTFCSEVFLWFCEHAIFHLK